MALTVSCDRRRECRADCQRRCFRANTGDNAATGVDGRYCITLAAGIYDLEFRRDGYVLSYVRGVIITNDVTNVGQPLRRATRTSAPKPGA